jgi:chromosome segregation ATPase
MNFILYLGTLLVGIGTIAGAIFMFVGPRDRRDANRIAQAAVDQSERQTDLDVMTETIDTLRANLGDAQDQVTMLRGDLAKARQETRQLRDETTTALANVAVLSDHIRQHVPTGIPFPRLRSVGS